MFGKYVTRFDELISNFLAVIRIERSIITMTVSDSHGSIAYIDGANLHKGIQSLGWDLDYKKFYHWLTTKYHTERVVIFLGYIARHQPLYGTLTAIGYDLTFKEITTHGGHPKGNCDAEMVLRTVSDFYERKLTKAILVTGDGDFACLVDFLRQKGALHCLIAPNLRYTSYLLRKRNLPTVYLGAPRLIPHIRKDP